MREKPEPGEERRVAVPRKRPRQQRSRVLVASVREACLRILDDEGAASLTTNRIAEVAGVAIGSIYQYFPNKEAIVAAVYEEVVEAELRAMAAVGEDLRRLSLEQAIRRILREALARENRMMKLHREFYRRHFRSFDVGARWGVQARDPAAAVEVLAQLLERERHALRTRDPRLAAFLIARGMRAIIWVALEERPEYISDPAFLAELEGMSLRYLLR